ncbi:DEAD/DEAH box helicase family protein [Mycoplasma sp. 527]
MNLTNSQEKVINALINKTINSLEENKQNSVYFKAPTGSGKTFMMINYIDKLIEWNKFNFNQNLVFVIATLSSAELPKQMEENFNEYKQYLINNDLKITRIESPSNINKNSKVEKNYQFFAKPNNVYIMGGASFKANAILREQHAIEAFLDEIKLNDYKLIYIRDEAHIGADTSKNKKDEISFEQNMQSKADFVIKMTATPTDLSLDLIELSEKDLFNDKIRLLKSEKIFNEGIEDNEDISYIDNDVILEQACLKFKDIKKQYNDDKNEPGLVGINAAMLIQVDNASKDPEKEKIFNETIDLIIKKLEKHSLSWVKYFDKNDKESSLRQKDNFSLRDISKYNSDTDVIIFKVGPATGWNIPRACMLVQLRNVSSKTLSAQTIGRIKRNPNPSYDFRINSIANKYYIYSNVDRDINAQRMLILKSQFKKEKFMYGSLVNINKSNSVFNLDDYEKQVANYLNNYSIENFETKYRVCKKEFCDNNFIIANQKSYGNKIEITLKLKNKIDMELFNIKTIKNNKKIFTENIKKEINSIYETKLKSIMDKTFFWFLIIKYEIENFNDFYKKHLQKQLDNQEIRYVINNSKFLPDYLIESKDDGDPKTDNKFAYQEINKEFANIYLKSEAEKTFVNEFKKCVSLRPEIRIWAKNPVHSGINFEYINNNFDISNSYPDFIIVHENHYIYLEIKTYKHDIDKDKTKKLIEEYRKYINNINNNLEFKLTLAIIFVDIKGNNLYANGASTIKSLNDMFLSQNDNWDKNGEFFINNVSVQFSQLLTEDKE